MISKTPNINPLFDIMGNSLRWETKIHEHGFVALVDVMPRMVPLGGTADTAIVQAARVSYGEGTKTPTDDEGLIRYLMRHRHTTPLEMVVVKLHCKMPIFVARQWIRHRMSSTNEVSGRYSVMKEEFYRPTVDGVRAQSQANKQGSEGQIKETDAEGFLECLNTIESLSAYNYKEALGNGVARELARIQLPLSTYTEWYWKIDLHNLFHFLSLRMDSHAQQEIRDYANAMFAMLEEIAPMSCRAFRDYRLDAMTLSGPEIKWLAGDRKIRFTDNKREWAEFIVKAERLGITV